MVNRLRSWQFWLAIILVTGVLLRIGLAFYLGDEIEELRGGTYDQISYDSLAQRVVRGYGFTFENDWWPATRGGEPTAHWSFLYVVALAGLYQLLGHTPLIARLLQAALVGIMTPWLIYRIGTRTFSRQAGLIAAAISAIYAYFIMYSASLMTESIYIVCILWAIDAAMRLIGSLSEEAAGQKQISSWSWIGRGLELGLAVVAAILLRQVIVAFMGVLVIWMLWASWRVGLVRRVLLPLLTAFVTILLVVSPVLFRNYTAFGRITSINTNAGYAFFWSNHPIYGTHFESVLSEDHGVSYQDLIPEELRHLDEAALDRALFSRGVEFIVDEPIRYLKLSLSRIPVYFLFWPKSDSTLLSNAARLLSFALFLPAMIYGMITATRSIVWPSLRRRSEETVIAVSDRVFEFCLLLLSFIVVYSAIHILSWANVRYRLPVDAVLIIFAGYGLNELYARLSRDRLSTQSTSP